MSDPVVNCDDSNFESEVLKSAVPTMVLFCVTWSGPCKSMAITFEDVARTYAGRARFARIDTDVSPDTTKSLAIRSLPAVRLFKNGNVVATVDSESKAKLTAALDANL